MNRFKIALMAVASVFLLTTYSTAFDFGIGGDFGSFDTRDVKDAFKTGKDIYKASSDLNEEEQYYLGRASGASILASNKLTLNSKLQKYVSSIGQTLALASPRPQTLKGYHFIVLDEPKKVNAYAVPSGFIFITTGLIAKAENEDQLAGILAHEISHVVLYHPTDSVKQLYRDKLKKRLAGRAISEATRGSGNSALWAGTLNSFSNQVIDGATKGYSRDKEDAADREAVSIMITAGYNPVEFSKVLYKLSPIGSGKSGTHGNPSERAGKVDGAARNQGGTGIAVAVERTGRFSKNSK